MHGHFQAARAGFGEMRLQECAIMHCHVGNVLLCAQKKT